jgi:hypothetical protein
VLTLVFFATLLVLMSRILPSATDLGDLWTANQSPSSQDRPASLAGSLAGFAESSVWKNVSLSVLDNEVMRKESNSVAWRPAKSGVALAEGDGIQTTREGMAVVAFDRKNHLRIGRNSLVILRKPEASGPSRQRPATSFSVVSGEMWGSFSGGTEAPIEVDLPSSGIATRVETHTPSQFKVTVLNDKRSAIAIYDGSARVNTGGKTVALRENEYVVVDSSGVPSTPKRLLAAPAPLHPRRSERRTYREFPPNIVFQWRPVERADEYRLVIARDPGFRQVVVDERLSEPSYSIGSLAHGEYWWTVSSIDAGVDGPPSAPTNLSMVEDRRPPELSVTRADARSSDDALVLEGRSEPGARVFVAGTPAVVQDDGRFRSVTPLKPGINLVVVEAVDEAGNTAYRSQEVLRVQEGGQSVP